MGCKLAKDSIKSADEFSPEKGEAFKDRSKDYNHNSPTPGADTSPKAAKYLTRIDRRVTSKYDIKALIGKGTFSEVLRVESKISKQPFAVKLVKVQTDIEKQLSTAELGALAKISHHFVVKLEEAIISKSVIYLVMQLATGGELYDRIKSKGHFDERYSCNITQMLLEAIFYLHLNGIIHRDLKPENILFYHPGHDSKILITDFGFAKVQNGIDDDYATTWCGTPEYIGPELIKRTPYDYKVDLWAVGVIVYVMLSGHLPFSAPTTSKLFNLIEHGIYSYKRPVWLTISDCAKDFIDNLLVVNPLSRLDAHDASHHSWVTSYSPLHKTKNNTILSKFNATLKRQKVVNSERILDVPYIINMTVIDDKNDFTNNVSAAKDNHAFHNSEISISATPNKLNKRESIDGLILPVTGEFQGQLITKEKVLEDNTSTMSPSNLDSLLTVDNSNSTSNNGKIIHAQKKNGGVEFEVDKQLAQFDEKETSVDKAYSPMKLNDNGRYAYEAFEIIDEISEDEPIYNVLSNPFSVGSFPIESKIVSPQIAAQNEMRTGYIEKVGVWLNNADSGVEETCFIEENLKSPNSEESCITLEKTISTDTNYHSAHSSSFDRFLLPYVPKNQQQVNIPLKKFRSSETIPHNSALYNNKDIFSPQ